MNVLERHVDLLLLVVRANQTSQQVVRRALGSLRGSKPIQVILNAVANQSLPYYMNDYTMIESRRLSASDCRSAFRLHFSGVLRAEAPEAVHADA